MEKHTADAFNGTDLAECLERLSVGAIAICGFVTEGCVDPTVRRASSLGFQVELAADAHSTTDGQVLRAEQIIEHHNSVLAIFGEVKATDEIQFSLGGGVQWGNVEAEGPPGT
jgi:nicotinamidase-related amidase